MPSQLPLCLRVKDERDRGDRGGGHHDGGEIRIARGMAAVAERHMRVPVSTVTVGEVCAPGPDQSPSSLAVTVNPPKEDVLY